MLFRKFLRAEVNKPRGSGEYARRNTGFVRGVADNIAPETIERPVGFMAANVLQDIYMYRQRSQKVV